MNKRKLITIGLLSAVILFGIMLFHISKEDSSGPSDTNSLTESSTDGVPDLRTEVLLEGLQNVWDVGFTSTGTALFTERSGEISKIYGDAKQVLLKVPNVVAIGEGGLMGLTVDPDFAQNRFIYACYNTANDIRVSRWRLNESETVLENSTDIVTGIPNNTTTYPGRHSGCRPRFGADGNLWIGTGDVAIGTNPQDPASLGGKILRVDRNGRAIAGNLTLPFDTRIYSYGHRNVQGLAMYRSVIDGSYGFSVEHGTGVDDEINSLVSGNFGYNPVPGYNERVSMTDKNAYPDAVEALWSSGTTIAPSGATMLYGEKWGTFDGAIAVAVLKDKQLRIFELTNVSKIQKETTLFDDKFGRLRSAVLGPDENLYLTTDNGKGEDKIIRVLPQ